MYVSSYPLSLTHFLPKKDYSVLLKPEKTRVLLSLAFLLEYPAMLVDSSCIILPGKKSLNLTFLMG